MKYATIAVIYNPNSTGSGEKLARNFAVQIKERLPRQHVQLLETKHAGHGEALSYELARAHKNPLIISSSGDGGYNDVINGAMRAKHEGFHATTGLLPAGNANDHYNNLHTDSLVKQVVQGVSTKIDVLKISATTDGTPVERYAHSYIGFGLTPAVGDELNKTDLNPLKELFVVAIALMKVRPIRLKIGKKPRFYESVICSNVDSMSKYLKISQPSSMTDGKFEVTIFRRRNKLQLILLLLKASVVGVTEDEQVREFRLETLSRTLVQADGEIMTIDGKSEAVISIEQQALRCIV